MPIRRRRTLMPFLLIAACTLLPACGSLVATQKSVESLETRRGFNWERRDAPGFVIRVERGPGADETLEALARDAERARAGVLAYVGIDQYPTVALFGVASHGRMGDLIGRETRGTAYHASNAVCIVTDDATLGRTTHELFHAVAMNVWGVPERWINEGAAVDADTSLRAVDLYALAGRLRARGELPSLHTLTHRFDSMPSRVSYVAAGSFVRFLRERFGMVTVRTVWTDGAGSLSGATGQSIAELEAAWLGAISNAPASNPANPGALDHDH